MPVSHTSSPRQMLDIRRRVEADRHLQVEIDRGLASLAEDPPPIVGRRIARVLSAVLDPSWSEHADFQDEVLFPIIANANQATPGTRALLVRLGHEHVEIDHRHREIAAILNDLAAGRRNAVNGFATLFLRALDLRRCHHEAEASLDNMLPEEIEPADRMALDRWAANRTAPPFPVSLFLDLWE